MTDIFQDSADRSPKFVINFSGRIIVFDEVNREACDLTVIEKSSKRLGLRASFRAYK
jgi:hypothetical protein